MCYVLLSGILVGYIFLGILWFRIQYVSQGLRVQEHLLFRNAEILKKVLILIDEQVIQRNIEQDTRDIKL